MAQGMNQEKPPDGKNPHNNQTGNGKFSESMTPRVNGMSLHMGGYPIKKFLFVSKESVSGDLAWRLQLEGHRVKVYISNPDDADVYDGFVEKVKVWEPEVDWADVIVFDDVGFGVQADQLRQRGKLVIGGSEYTDQLEDDREFGQAELKKHDINTLRWWQFDDYDKAIEFIKAHPSRYVFKPSGSAPKSLLFIGQEEDGRDLLELFQNNKQIWRQRAPHFVLQRYVSGVEVAVGAYFNGHDFLYPININFEHKRIFPGNLGPFTGEMGTLMYWSTPNNLFREILLPMHSALKASRYVGYVDINCIVNARGIYPLEFTCRFGYPTIHIQLEGIEMPIGEFLHRMANGEDFQIDTKRGFQLGVRLLLPTYFSQEPHTELVRTYRDLAISFKTRPTIEGIHIEDIKKVDDVWRVAGTSGCVLVVTGSGATVEEARRVAYGRAQNVLVPNIFYRTDIGMTWSNDRDRLHTWGYLR
ncbi:MAG: phosphoribosylamine--glycine ligase [Patescibacteria group bacterium]